MMRSIMRNVIFLGALTTAHCGIIQKDTVGTVTEEDVMGEIVGRRSRLEEHTRKLKSKISTDRFQDDTTSLTGVSNRGSVDHETDRNLQLSEPNSEVYSDNLFCEGNDVLSQLFITTRENVHYFLGDEGNAMDEVAPFVRLVREYIATENEVLASLYADRQLLIAAMAPDEVSVQDIDGGNETRPFDTETPHSIQGMEFCADNNNCVLVAEDIIAESIDFVLSTFTSLPGTVGVAAGKTLGKKMMSSSPRGTRLIRKIADVTSTGEDDKVEQVSAIIASIIIEAGVNNIMRALTESPDLSVGKYVAISTKLSADLSAISATGGAYLAATVNSGGVSVDGVYKTIINFGDTCNEECEADVEARESISFSTAESDGCEGSSKSSKLSKSSKSSKSSSKSSKTSKSRNIPTYMPTMTTLTPTRMFSTDMPTTSTDMPTTSTYFPTTLNPTETPGTMSPTITSTLVPAPIPDVCASDPTADLCAFTFLQTSTFDEVDPSRYVMDLSLQVIEPGNADAYVLAREMWTEVITGDLFGFPSSAISDNDRCANSLPETIDDTHICAADEVIDGPRGILGSAGVIFQRTVTATGLVTPITGEMVFDLEDIPTLIEDGTYETVILHEMGHVLGIGTLWEDNNLVDEDLVYLGENAIDVWQNDWGCDGTPPVETDFGPGTRGGHWDEDCLVDELMTGFLGEVAGRLSTLTIASLEDMGYEVNYDAADEYDGSDTTCCTAGISKPSKPTQPPLSVSGRAAAFAYGKNILSAKQGPEEISTDDEGNSIEYVGDKRVVVLFMENENIYHVVVTNTDESMIDLEVNLI